MSKLKMTRFVRSLTVAASAALFFASCGTQKAGGGGTGGNEAGGPVDCGVLEELPANITIVDASNGSPICDPTFAVELDGSTSVQVVGYRCLAANSIGCPAIPTTDGQPQPCVFIVYGLHQTGHSDTLAVGAPGYLTTQVANVAGGQAATCGFPYVAPSQLTVKLSPVPSDAGAVDHR